MGARQGRGRRPEQQDRVHIHRVLSTALNYAVDLQYLQTNVARFAHPPKPEDREMQALDVDAVQKMLTALETWPDHRLRAIALIATSPA